MCVSCSVLPPLLPHGRRIDGLFLGCHESSDLGDGTTQGNMCVLPPWLYDALEGAGWEAKGEYCR